MTKQTVRYTRKRKDFLRFFVTGDQAKPEDAEEVSFGHLKEAQAEAAASSYDGKLRTESIPNERDSLYQYFLKVGTDHKGQFQCCHDSSSTEVTVGATFDFGSLIMPGLTAEVGAAVTAEAGELAILAVLVHQTGSNDHNNSRSVSLARMIGSLRKAGLKLKANVGFDLGSSDEGEPPDTADEANASVTGATELLAWEWEAQAMASAELSLHGEWMTLADKTPRSHPRGSSAALESAFTAATRSIKDVLTEQVQALTAAGAFGGYEDPIRLELRKIMEIPAQNILYRFALTDPIETYCDKLVALYRRGIDEQKLVAGTLPSPIEHTKMVGYLEQVAAYYAAARRHAGRIVVAHQIAAIEKFQKDHQRSDDADLIEKLTKSGRGAVDQGLVGSGIKDYSITLKRLIKSANDAAERTPGNVKTIIMEYRALLYDCWWALAPYLLEAEAGPCSLTMWGATGGASADAKASLKVSSLKAEATLAAAKYTGKRSGYRFQSMTYGTSKAAKNLDNPVNVTMTQDTLLRYSETQFEALKLAVTVDSDAPPVEIPVTETEGAKKKKWYHGLSYASAVAYWRPTDTGPVLVGSGHGYSFGRTVLLENLLTYGPSKGRWSKDLAKHLHISREQLEQFFMGGAWSLCWDLHHKGKQIQAEALLIETSFAAKPNLSWKNAKKAEINEFLEGFLKAEESRGKPPGSTTGPEPGTLEAIRIRYRIADDVEDSKTNFKLGIGILGSSVEIEAASIRRAGSSGVVDLYTMWIDPRLADMAKKPATLHQVPEEAVPAVVLFSL